MREWAFAESKLRLRLLTRIAQRLDDSWHLVAESAWGRLNPFLEAGVQMRVVEIADRSVLTRWLLMLLAVVLGVGLATFQSPPVLADPTSDPSADPSSGGVWCSGAA